MSKTQLFIPDKCKVGLQLRQGTYTGKLGYIIYNDGKVWRKEPSWNSWRHKVGEKYAVWDSETRNRIEGVHDESVKPIEFDNVPTEGFVLNKKVGGGNSGWNNRQTYSRVYDPRGWEFEITVQNLLYILQECNSYKGKGLEGEFVYSWEGKDLVLLPVSSPDYKTCKDFTDLQSVKFSKKDLIPGHVYLTNKMEEWMYVGYYHMYEPYGNYVKYEDDYHGIKKPVKKHIFIPTKVEYSYEPYFIFLSSLTKIKKKISEDFHPKFADYVDEYLNSKYASEADHLEIVPFDKEFLKDSFDRNYLFHTKIYVKTGEKIVTNPGMFKRSVELVKDSGGIFEVYTESYNHSSYWNRTPVDRNSDGKFTLAEIKKKYGMLVRVYKNGFKKQIN